MYQAALSAKTEEEASQAIHILGAMGATEELRKLGDRPNAASGLVDAYAISGDFASLRKIAEGTGDRAVRIEAVRKIGMIQRDEARTALQEIYSRQHRCGNPQDAALQGHVDRRRRAGRAGAVPAAQTSDEKRSLLRTLSMMDGDAALQAIDAALEKKR